MRSEIPNRNKSTGPHTDTRLNSAEFYEPCLNRQIAIRELVGGEAFNDFMEHISQVRELKHDEGMQAAVTELESLMRGHRIGNNSAGNLKFRVLCRAELWKCFFTEKEGNPPLVWKFGR